MEKNELGVILVVFISIIVGVVLFQVIAQQNGTMLDKATLTNETFTASAKGSSFYLTDYQSLDVTSIHNGTGAAAAIPATNYTVTNGVVYNGALAVEIAVNDEEFASETWAINGEAEPLTYVSNSATRGIIPLIVIFFALAIGVIALTPTLRSGVLDMMK